jgi:hypothetical protein
MQFDEDQSKPQSINLYSALGKAFPASKPDLPAVPLTFVNKYDQKLSILASLTVTLNEAQITHVLAGTKPELTYTLSQNLKKLLFYELPNGLDTQDARFN